MKHKRLKKRQRFELKQLIDYLISGGAYFVTGYIAFFVLYQVLHWNLFWSKITADVIGWVVNYLLQRYWVFDNAKLDKHKVQVTDRYIIITLVDFGLDYLIVWYLKSIGLTPYLGQFVSAGFFTFWNYFWYRWWVFPEQYPRKKRKHA